jgi:cell division protein FtsQ
MARKDSASPPGRSVFRYWYASVVALVGLIAGIFLFGQVEHWLINDRRFQLAGPTYHGEESPNLTLTGVRHASRTRILQSFSEDFNRSIYLFPLQKRRLNLLAVDWVRDATIERIWPNKARVHITERQPVAFVALGSGGAHSARRFAMIDEDGIFLQPAGSARFHLPVLTGVDAEEPRERRMARVGRMQRVLAELRPVANRISEIDVADLDDVRITMQVEDRALVLLLGHDKFGRKVRNFQEHYPEIRKRLPFAATLDLRIDDRITVVERGSQQ